LKHLGSLLSVRLAEVRLSDLQGREGGRGVRGLAEEGGCGRGRME